MAASPAQAPGRLELDEQQERNARLIYRLGRGGGLSAKRARELVTVAWHESRLRSDAVNASSGAAGLFQLLSAGYRRAAEALGGLLNPEANTRAILPAYVRYWREKPTAPIGAGGRDVERSGQSAAWYARDYEAFAWLDDTSAGGATKPRPARFGDWLELEPGVDVTRVAPGLLARAWLLGAYLGRKIKLVSGWRSDEEQVAIWNSGVRPAAKPIALGGPGSNHSRGIAVDAFFADTGEAVGADVPGSTLAEFGLKAPVVDDEQHLELAAATSHDPNKPVAISAALVPALRAVWPKLAPAIRKRIGQVGGAAAAAVGSVAGTGAIAGVGFLALTTRRGKRAALIVLFAVFGLALILLGVLRLVGVRSGDVVNVAIGREG